MNIAFDVDGVITDEPSFLKRHAVPFFKRYFKKDVVNPDALRVHDIFSCPLWQAELFWVAHIRSYVYNEPARFGMKKLFDRLASDGDTIYVITKRAMSDSPILGKWMRKRVEKTLSSNGLRFKEIVFAPKHSLKDDLCRYHEIDILVEDFTDTIIAASRYIDVICFDAAHNQSCIGKNIHRVFSVDDIYTAINMIKLQHDDFDKSLVAAQYEFPL